MGAAIDFAKLEKTLIKIVKKTTMVHNVVSGDWVLPSIIEAKFGFSEDQLSNYRRDGFWLEGTHFKRNPANRIVYSPDAINAWQAEFPEPRR